LLLTAGHKSLHAESHCLRGCAFPHPGKIMAAEKSASHPVFCNEREAVRRHIGEDRRGKWSVSYEEAIPLE
jgi:hypothetical protein